MSGGGIPVIRYDLAQYALVTSVTSPTVFTCSGLAGFDNSEFVGYSAYVLHDAGDAGAAPQTEQQLITAFVGSNGQITITAGYTAAIAVGDALLLLHPSVANSLKTSGLPPVSNSVVANWQAAEQTLVSIGAAGVRNKVQTLFIDMTPIVGALTIRCYHIVNGVQRQVYSQNFTVAADGPGRWTINGTVGIFGILRVTCQSNNIADNGAAIAYSYMLEAM